jgi:hypothetical protein
MSRARQEPAPAEFTTVADGVRAQVVRRQLLPAHLDSSAHAGRSSTCRCSPLLEQLTTVKSWPVRPAGAREACTQEEHELAPLRAAAWPDAPLELRALALRGHVDLVLTMCRYCGAVEVRDVSFHHLAGLAAGNIAPRRRSDVLGWYGGKRPAGRVYL